MFTTRNTTINKPTRDTNAPLGTRYPRRSQDSSSSETNECSVPLARARLVPGGSRDPPSVDRDASSSVAERTQPWAGACDPGSAHSSATWAAAAL